MLDSSTYSNLPAAHPAALPPRQSRSQLPRSAERRWDRQLELLRAHLWFHGRLSRADAEKRVTENGCFLVRASSSLGGFVVTARWNGRHCHVAILPSSEQSSEQFHFDGSYAFADVPDLVLFYKDSQMPISAESGAILFTPVPTTACGAEKGRERPRYRQRSRGNSASRSKAATKTKGRLKKFGSEPLLQADSDGQARPRRASNAEAVTAKAAVESAAVSPHYPPRANSLSSVAAAPSSEERPGPRRGSVNGHLPARPLPRHSPDVNPAARQRPNVRIRNPAVFYDDGGGDYTDYAQVRAVSSTQRLASMRQSQGDYITMEDGPHSLANSSCNLRLSFQSDYVASTAVPSPDPLVDAHMWSLWTSAGPLAQCAPDTEHLPGFAKPLDGAVWPTVLRLLADADEDRLAGCVARESCRLLYAFPATCRIPALANGFQLMLVPRAQRFREQLTHRSYCLSRFVAASILMAQPHERNRIVRKWIDVAESLVMVYRDYYSLHAVNDGLFCSQVRQVVNAVTLLPQPSNLATSVGREIRLSHRRGDDCCLSPHIDICVPDVAHFLHVFSASYDDLLGETPDSLWELTVAARAWAGPQRRLWVAEMRVEESAPVLRELFATEVQMKLLWGARGYSLPVADRQMKLEAILAAFAKKAVMAT